MCRLAALLVVALSLGCSSSEQNGEPPPIDHEQNARDLVPQAARELSKKLERVIGRKGVEPGMSLRLDRVEHLEPQRGGPWIKFSAADRKTITDALASLGFTITEEESADLHVDGALVVEVVEGRDPPRPGEERGRLTRSASYALSFRVRCAGRIVCVSDTRIRVDSIAKAED